VGFDRGVVGLGGRHGVGTESIKDPFADRRLKQTAHRSSRNRSGDWFGKRCRRAADLHGEIRGIATGIKGVTNRIDSCEHARKEVAGWRRGGRSGGTIARAESARRRKDPPFDALQGRPGAGWEGDESSIVGVVVCDEMDGLQSLVERGCRGECQILGKDSRVPDCGLVTGGEYWPIRIEFERRAGSPSDRREWIGSSRKDLRHPLAWFGIEGRLGHHHLDRAFLGLTEKR
jgi:hypothetical protein